MSTRTSRTALSLVLGALVSLAASPAAKAGAVTYAYTGNHFNDFNNGNPGINHYPLTNADFITASFTFAKPLPANLLQQPVVPVSWAVSDQVTTYSSGGGDIGSLDVTTDASGGIIGWDFGAQYPAGACSGAYGVVCPYPLLFSEYGFVSTGTDSSQIWCGGSVPCQEASVSGAPGTWTETGNSAPFLTAPANGATGVPLALSLSWSAATGATSYDVYVGTATPPSFVTNTTGTSYSPGTLSAGTTYYWQVAARNSAGTASSDTWSFTTLVAEAGAVIYTYTGSHFNDVNSENSGINSYPLTNADFITASFTFAKPLPANLLQQPVVPVSWAVSDQVTDYSSGGGDVGSLGVTTDASGGIIGWDFGAQYPAGACSGVYGVVCPYPLLFSEYGFVSTGADTSQIWCGGSVPCQEASVSGAPGTWTETGNSAPILTAPANRATGVPRTPSLSWSAAAGATSYDVHVGTATPPSFVTNTTGTSYSPGTLSAGTTYYWQVVARDSAGTASSDTWSFTTLVPAPVAPVLSSPADGATGVALAPALVWNTASLATSYDLYFGASSPPTMASNTTATTYTPGILNSGTTYYWQVVARNVAGTASSATWSFTTGAPVAAVQYLITTVAGGGLPPSGVPAVSASFQPWGVAADGQGNFYFAAANSVFRVDSGGVLTRVAGSTGGGYSGDGGPATSAQLGDPIGVAVDGAGNLYIADTENSVIRMVAPNGTITTVAGNGTQGYSGDGSSATSAQLSRPWGVAADRAGDLYIVDYGNNVIRKVAANGSIATVAGNGGYGYSGDGGLATSAQLKNPLGVAVDAAGNLYIADSNNEAVRKVDVHGIITTVAGDGKCCHSGDGGPATSAELASPDSVALDAAGNLYIAERGADRVRKVAANGIITTVAGNGKRGYSGDGGPATSAELHPDGIAVDTAGNLYISDGADYVIRKVDVHSTITTAAGSGREYSGDGGPATGAQLYGPEGAAVDAAGDIYIADTVDNVVRRVATDGTITTAAGGVNWGYSGDGGPATSAGIDLPAGVATDAAGNLYIADELDNVIRKVANGTITTVAGTGDYDFSGDGGPATSAELNMPQGVAVDAAGNLYIADTYNYRVRKVAVDGTITTVAGNGTAGFSGDGGPATGAQLNAPAGVAVDLAGNLFIADCGNNRVREVAPNGTITTVAGNGTGGYAGDGGPAISAQLNSPSGVAADGAGSLYVADTCNHRIRKVAIDGTITTVAGTGTAGYSGDGGSATVAQLNYPYGVAVDAAGRIYIADTDNNVIRLLVPQGTSSLLSVSVTQPAAFTPGQTGATYSVAVSNAAGAGPTGGTVTVSEIVPTGLTLVSMSGTGWNCSGNTCTRSDVLQPGSSFPPITVTVNVAADAPSQVISQITLSGGGSVPTGASATTNIAAPPATPALASPGNGAGGVVLAPTLVWNASTGAASYDVYFGASSPPPLVTSTAATRYAPGTLNAGTTYYWQIAAHNAAGSAVSATWSFTTGAPPVAVQYLITTVAGGGVPPSGVPAASAPLSAPQAVAVDGQGNVYFSSGNWVFKVDGSGALARVAGSAVGGYSGDGGPAIDARLDNPRGVAVDAAGNVYIADYWNSAIRKVAPDGTITTLAGQGTYEPWGVAVDVEGNVYIADLPDNAIRKVAANGAVTTVAGTGTFGYSGDGGPATSAELAVPSGVVVDTAGNLYIADSVNNRVRKVAATTGIITTIAGPAGIGQPLDLALDGAGNLYISDGYIRKVAPNGIITTVWTSALGVAVDGAGNLYAVDTNANVIRRVAANGTVTTLAGNGSAGFGDGGPATSAGLSNPYGVAVDARGNLYIADSKNVRIRKAAPDGTITTVAGAGDPYSVALDAAGNVYFDDGQLVRKVSVNGTITTVAGGGTSGLGDGGPATAAQLDFPSALAVDAAGNLYIAEQFGNRIRMVAAATGIITTVAGGGTSGLGDGGLATSAQLFSPTGVALDAAGNLYIADLYNYRIRMVAAATGVITTVAGGGSASPGDGGPATAAQICPDGVGVDAAGNLYIADPCYSRIRKVATDGTITTVAGSGTRGYSGDGGPATSAQLDSPYGLAVDAAGRIYIADPSSSVIRLLVPQGTSSLLSVSVTQPEAFTPGQTGATYSVVVSNAAGAAPTNGTVTVTDPTGLTLVSMSGTGWNCSGNTCTRSDVLQPGASFPPITVTVNVAADAPSQVTSQISLSGGGSAPTSASATTNIVAPPAAPGLTGPSNGAIGVVTAPTLAWNASTGATSYDVYFGASSAPPWVTNTTATSYAPGTLNANNNYYWQVAARNAGGTASSGMWSFTTGVPAVGLRFIPVTPCRVVDTRGPGGPFGSPSLAADSTRSFAIPQGGCGIPEHGSGLFVERDGGARGSALLPDAVAHRAGAGQRLHAQLLGRDRGGQRGHRSGR